MTSTKFVVLDTLWDMSRGKSWRRSEAAKERRDTRTERLQTERNDEPREKNWKLLYLRSNKLARARQLGFDYPRKSRREVIDEHMSDGPEDKTK